MAGPGGNAEEGGGNLGWEKRGRKREPGPRRPGRKARVWTLHRARKEARTKQKEPESKAEEHGGGRG